MNNNKANLPARNYHNHLEIISGVKFTSREIDVIACLLGGRSTKTICQFLSIEEKTVETHKYNIMRKLDANSKESIINFIEKSDQLSSIKKHYLDLLSQALFEKKIQEVLSLPGKRGAVCSLVYWQGQEQKTPLVSQLEKHLKLAGFKISLEIRENYRSLNHLIHNIESQTLDNIIYIIPTTLLEQFRVDDSTGKLEIFPFVQKASQNPGSVIFLLNPEDGKIELPSEIQDVGYVNFKEHEHYYFSIFEILKKVMPDKSLDKIVADFQKQHKTIHSSSETLPTQMWPEINASIEEKLGHSFFARLSKKKKRWLISGCILFVSAVFLLFYNPNDPKRVKVPQAAKSQELYLARSDLPIPAENALLQRPKLLAQMDGALNGKDGIQTIALVGIGGVGKTTLARQYAQIQKLPIIWEINAETHETLINSFENLAWAFVKTEEEEIILKGIQEIRNPKAREEKIILFVKEHLRINSNWLLIYDNVENFIDIQKYFPLDYHTWGQGKIIVTTRNINIQGNKHINATIKLGELDDKQKFILFIKIITQGGTGNSRAATEEETREFLEQIPPFPLDISLAAYYLKTTNTPYNEYLYNLSQYNKDFVDVQADLLKETGDYLKTRYSIITLSFQHVINAHKDFEGLVFFVSLLASQNIPKELLAYYKNSSIVDKFIYHLKRYSLINNEPSSSTSIISFHRSTQIIILTYLIKILNEEKRNLLIKDIVKALERYVANSIDKEDFGKMTNLLNHCEALSDHKNLIPQEISASINGELGCLYFYMGNLTKAVLLLKQSIPNLNKNYYVATQVLLHLGMLYRDLGKYEESKDALEESYLISQKHKPQDHARIAQVLTHLGLAYYEIANYVAAKDTMTKSLMMCQKHLSKNHVRVLEVLAILGNVHRQLGEYKEAKDIFERATTIHKNYPHENQLNSYWFLLLAGYLYEDLGDYEKAITALEQSVVIIQKHLPDKHLYSAWPLAYLGYIYNQLGNYRKAKDMLEQSLIICQNHLPENSADFNWPLSYLGMFYESSGDFEKAKEILEKSLIICKRHLPKSHDRIAVVLSRLGNIYRELRDYENAKSILEESLITLKKHLPENQVDVMLASVNLGKLYKDLGNFQEATKLLEHNIAIYEKHYGKDHFETARVLRELAAVYVSQGNLINAEALLHRSLKIFQQHKHSEQYKCLESLSDLYLQKSTHAINKAELQQSQKLKKQAITYLMQAQKILETHFPEQSPHLIRIQEKLKSLQDKEGIGELKPLNAT